MESTNYGAMSEKFTSKPELAPQYSAASRRRFDAPTSFFSSKSTTSPTSKI